MNQVLDNIRKDLIHNVDEQTKRTAQNFFKEKVQYIGVRSSIVKKIALQYAKDMKDLPKKEIFQLCEKLMQTDYCEESYIACEWAYAQRKKYEPADFEIFESWIHKYVNNWAKCDTFCNHTVGDFVMQYPEFVERLKKWAHSQNRWMKRAAAVTLIIPARKGLFLKEIFQIADSLFTDPDDLVQKGYGWMLKAASQAHQGEVFDYVMSKKAQMPRTALRYAIEKMPPELRKQAMS